MTKFEEYTQKAADSAAAVEAATTERERIFHRRAQTIYQRLILGIGEAEDRAAAAPVVKKSVRPAPRASVPNVGRRG